MKSDLEINSLAMQIRDKMGYGAFETIDIEDIILKLERYSLVRVVLSGSISGICISDRESKVIAVNSKMSIGRQRFTMGHELYHLEVEKCNEGKICLSALHTGRDDSEKEADMFASFLLMPYEALNWFESRNQIDEWTMKEIIDLSQFYKMSDQAVLFRLRYQGKISQEKYEDLKKEQVLPNARLLGYDVVLYCESDEKEQWSVLGEYKRLLGKNAKTLPESLYRQFCRDAFIEGMEAYEGEEILND